MVENDNEPLHAHVDILSRRSEYFRAMFRSNMRESIELVVQVQDCSKGHLVTGAGISLRAWWLLCECGRCGGVVPHSRYQIEGLMSICRHEFMLDDVSFVKVLQVVKRNGSTCGVLSYDINVWLCHFGINRAQMYQFDEGSMWILGFLYSNDLGCGGNILMLSFFNGYVWNVLETHGKSVFYHRMLFAVDNFLIIIFIIC